MASQAQESLLDVTPIRGLFLIINVYSLLDFSQPQWIQLSFQISVASECVDKMDSLSTFRGETAWKKDLQ